ncbi:hypothetical protein OPQ81_002777 [Rhizoctonia solani]|nr:hypothetical protein OPQ81_002777 [Rhizoctonia solani]
MADTVLLQAQLSNVTADLSPRGTPPLIYQALLRRIDQFLYLPPTPRFLHLYWLSPHSTHGHILNSIEAFK